MRPPGADLGRRAASVATKRPGKLDASVDEPVCDAPAKFDAGPNLRNIVLHVLGRPATTVGDKWKLRKGEAKLSKEHQHLAGHRPDVVLPAYHDEKRRPCYGSARDHGS